MTTRPKIFGIGLNKTGTTTLGICLQQLGHRHTSFDLTLLEQVRAGDLTGVQQVVQAHDSFEDWPYPLIFKQLDGLYPHSRFVLTRRRSAEVWLRSLEAHALRTDPEVGPRARTLAYGWPYPQLDPPHHLALYEAHLRGVRAHFQDRPQQLLEVCWEEQASWEPLCRFLGLSPPDLPFPHANAAASPDPQRLLQNQQQIRRWSSDAAGDDSPLPR